MRISARIDQLRVYSHAIASTLNTSFHDMRDPKFISDLAQVTFRSGPILHNRSAADDFQVRDPGQIGQDFILHSVGKKCVIRIATAIFERQHGDAFLRDLCWSPEIFRDASRDSEFLKTRIIPQWIEHWIEPEQRRSERPVSQCARARYRE